MCGSSYAKLRPHEMLALVEVIKRAEYIHPSQVAKRSVFKKYGIYGTDRDPIVTAVYYGVMRKLGLIDKLIVRALGLPNVYILDPWLRAGLRLAAYLLHFARIPISAEEKKYLKRRVAKLISSKTHPYVGMYYWDVVEKVLPSYEFKPASEVEELELKYSMPAWFVEKTIKLIGREEAEQLFKVFNESPPISVRVNTLKATVEEVIEELAKEGKVAKPGKVVKTVLKFEGPYYFAKSKLVKSGKIVPQEEASAFASILLNPLPGETVVDMCAAPGGKTTHMAELMNNKGKIYALDISKSRLKRLEKLLKWTGVKIVDIHCLDARKAPKELGEEFADKVLLDAPCSSSGTLAKYPEVRWRLLPEKVEKIARYQLELLEAGVKLVKPGGRLLYTVCSIFPEEGEEVVKKILKKYKGCLKLVKLKGPYSPGFFEGTMRAWPHKHETVGFFYALFMKTRHI